MRGDYRFFSLINTTLTSCGCKRLLFYLNLPIPMISVDIIPIIPNVKVVYRIFGPLAILYKGPCRLCFHLFIIPPTSLSSSTWNTYREMMFLNVNNNYCFSWQREFFKTNILSDLMGISFKTISF